MFVTKIRKTVYCAYKSALRGQQPQQQSTEIELKNACDIYRARARVCAFMFALKSVSTIGIFSVLFTYFSAAEAIFLFVLIVFCLLSIYRLFRFDFGGATL